MNGVTTFEIDTGADLSDMWGGQTEFAVAAYMQSPEGTDIIGAGQTVREAVAEARTQLREWRAVRP